MVDTSDVEVGEKCEGTLRGTSAKRCELNCICGVDVIIIIIYIQYVIILYRIIISISERHE